MSEYVKIPKFMMHLQDNMLNAHAESYPEEVRANFLWLGAYLRDKCHRNLDVLEAQITKLGFSTTGGTIAKLIQGRWFKAANGMPTAPIIKIENFLQLVDRLKEHARLSDMAGKVPFVETGTWEDIASYVDVRRAPDQVCKFGLIVGPTGSQKTSCAKHYCMRNNHGACNHIEAPDTPSLGKFITDLAKCYGISEWASLATKCVKLSQCINETRCIFIDNIQRLYKDGDGWNQPIFNYLQKLQDDTNCTIILMCVPEFELTLRAGRERGYFEQFEGRCGGRDEFLILPEFTPREDLLQFASAFKLLDARRNIGILEQLCRQRGRLRVVFNCLQKATRLAKAEGDEKLTIDHIRAVLESTSMAKLVGEKEDK